MKKYEYLDLHVAGEPFRVIYGGLPQIKGAAMSEKRKYAEEHLDDLRRIVLLEPRGHDDMYGGFITEPVNAGSNLGVVFIHGSGTSTMCGHGVIALTRAAIELGLVKVSEGENRIVIDGPSGTVTTVAEVKDGCVENIVFHNDLSFACGLSQTVETQTLGKVTVDVGYGGAFMVFADISQFGLRICKENVPKMIDIAMECGENAIKQLAMVHPENPALNAKDNGICMILAETEEIEEKQISTRTFTVFGEGQFDRSPTGTGTSALAAVLFEKGILTEDKILVNRGISGVPFCVSVKADGSKVVPSIKSNAYLTGQGSILVEDTDPLQEGFTVKTGESNL